MPPVPTLHFGPFALEGPDDSLWHGSQRCKLTAKACAVLRYLVAHPGRLVRKADLLAAVWPDVHVSEWVLTTCIRELRQVLGDAAKTPQYIATVHRQGYRFIAPVTVVEALPPLPSPEDPRRAPLPVPLAPEATLLAGSPAPPAPATPAVPPTEGEYKPVSILCCALADAPALAVRLGSEGFYRLLQTVVELAQEVMQDYAGTLFHQTSEGITAVFGVPVAQEDHARRAVLAAFDLHQRLRQHSALRTLSPGSDLAVRMGLHSGRVVVGGLGQEPQRLYTVVGEPVHLATRLQQRAASGTILLSAATYALVSAEVRAAPCGTLDIDGWPAPVPVYTVEGLVRRHAGVAGHGPRAESPFVGRARELALLHERLAATVAGHGQVVGLVGEPGMGKTRLLTEFCRSLAGLPVTVYVGHCLSYGQATPYLPVRDLLRQVCGIGEGDTAAARTAAVQQRLHASGITGEEDGALLLQLLALPVAQECLERRSPQARQARTFALLRHLVLHAAQRQPLVLVVENLHWSDATSAAWLASLVERLAGATILLLATYRPGYQPPWGVHSAVTQVALPPLRARDSRTVVQAVLGAVALPEARLRTMVAHAGGNPFFLEELAWHAVGQTQPDTPGAVPETVHAVLAARLDRLPPAAKWLLQVAAVIGTEVSVPLLQAIAEQPEERLQQSLASLQAAEFLYETRLLPDLVYTFKHVLTQEVAYQSLLKSTRQQLHQCIAQVLETRFPTTAETQPAVLAHHYTEAACHAQAILYWQRAGQKAIEHSSFVEAVTLLSRGLALVEALPDTPERAQHELPLQTTLAKVLALTTGYGTPEVEHLLMQAQALCQRIGDASTLLPVQTGLLTVALARAELQTACALSEQLLRIAQRQPDPVLLSMAYRESGQTLLFLGELPAARAHLEQGLAYYNPQQHHSLDLRYTAVPGGVRCGVSLGWTLWLLGYPEQALTSVQAAHTLAQQLSHPVGLAYALDFAVGLHQLRREVQAVQERAQELRTFARAQELPLWYAWGTALHGWALAMQAHSVTGMAQLWEGVAAWRAMGVELNRPWLLALIAEGYGQAGQVDAGLAVLAEALVLVDKTDERWYEAELYRRKGELLLAQADTQDGAEEAEACFRQALSIAHRQQAKSWELRAATSLSRLWQRQGKCAEARALLAPIYAWFTEGFDTAALQEAKALLDALAGEHGRGQPAADTRGPGLSPRGTRGAGRVGRTYGVRCGEESGA